MSDGYRWLQCGHAYIRGGGALLGWFALLLQLYLILAQSPAGAPAMVGTVITYFSFFTIQTNILVALVFTASVLSPVTGWGQFFRRPPVQAGTAAYIAIVGIITVYCCGNLESAGPAVGRRRNFA